MRKSNLPREIDKIDLQILELLIEDKINKEISSSLGIPLSTVQRRVRKLIEKGLVTSKNYIDFTKFGFKSGSIHIYLSDGNIDFILEKVSKLRGINSLEVHIGNSDIIAEVLYEEGRALLNLIANIKKLEGVQRIIWSERIYEYPLKNNNISLLELETVT
ncbi:Lrp/AsnC family transcriptional regulator [Candidatus Nitrosocosmicus hydrocola]|uniref:Lrp/AsnC family transcriptional regulator n=1 Tax=Candidatus Nitrosocosmicus hydrocola TaxID=1826872 RepID=UPI000B21DFEF|nr:winged helix-turn-helix transcriptional regulator [Candidatus Nitrosocosmicus hydrocola]